MDHRPKYDDQAFKRIRRDLLAYKQRFRLGAPRLAHLIEESLPLKQFVNPRRVTRFLAGRRTEQDFAGWCDAFLQTVPQEKDAVWRLGQSMRALCDPQPYTDLAGYFSVGLISYPGDRPDDAVKVDISIEQAEGFYRVEERIEEPHQIADGAMVATPTGGVALLADRLTGSVRSYVLNVSGEAFSIDALESTTKRFSGMYHMPMARAHGKHEA